MERERDTRWRRIDPKLRASGWAIAEAGDSKLDELTVPTALPELSTFDGPADYALCAEGRVVGVVEAKKLTIGPEGVLTQAERYSRGIRQQPRFRGEYGVPFLYSTNGERIRFHDVRREYSRSRWVSRFHTPDALSELLSRDVDAELAALRALSPHPGLRPYQIDANQRTRSATASAGCSSRWQRGPGRR
jgi:type I restriction enzyme R subunit